MARFPSLPEKPDLADVFRRFPLGVKALCEYTDDLLRGPSPFTVGEREFLAAYVSGINACGYCHGAHSIIAELHGIDAELLAGALQDPAAAGVESRMLPILDYARKLTETPARMTDLDAQRVFDAGWSEEALYHAISVCAIFNFMNRIVEGCGVEPDPAIRDAQRERHEAMRGEPRPYTLFARTIGALD
ncbi:carboxymuconolactone decarboxylase family protein [Candidatus Foliamicus sp.]